MLKALLSVRAAVLPNLPKVKPVAAASTVKVDGNDTALVKDAPTGCNITVPVVLTTTGAEKFKLLPLNSMFEDELCTKPPARLPKELMAEVGQVLKFSPEFCPVRRTAPLVASTSTALSDTSVGDVPNA